MTEQLDNLRTQLDGLAKLAHQSGTPFASEKLLLAKAWIGKIKAAHGEESPYKNDGKRHTVADIEPADAQYPTISTGAGIIDKSNGEPDDKLGWLAKNTIEKIDWLRGEIKSVSASSEQLFASMWPPHGRYEAIARTNVYNYIVEAGFELGFQLGRIRDNADKRTYPFTPDEATLFKQYKRKGLSEMRPYILGESLEHISVSPEDFPSEGGMIARNPKNHADQWYVAKKYFEENLEPA